MPIEPGMYPTIKPDTALGRALVEFFDVLEPVYASGERGVFQVIIFGGCAVHIHTQARGSADVDAEVASHGYAEKSQIIALLGEDAYVFTDEEGVTQMLELDGSLNPPTIHSANRIADSDHSHALCCQSVESVTGVLGVPVDFCAPARGAALRRHPW